MSVSVALPTHSEWLDDKQLLLVIEQALEALLREKDRLKPGAKINAIDWLAGYLMRHNPNHDPKARARLERRRDLEAAPEQLSKAEAAVLRDLEATSGGTGARGSTRVRIFLDDDGDSARVKIVNDDVQTGGKSAAPDDDAAEDEEGEGPPDPELMRLHEEFLEEQRVRKQQFEATQKVQAIVKGNAARAEVESKKAPGGAFARRRLRPEAPSPLRLRCTRSSSRSSARGKRSTRRHRRFRRSSKARRPAPNLRPRWRGGRPPPMSLRVRRQTTGPPPRRNEFVCAGPSLVSNLTEKR